MTTPKIVRNAYCIDDEDRVIACSCPCCKSCWMFVASKNNRKNGMCPFGGPFEGFTDASRDCAIAEAPVALRVNINRSK